MVLRFALKIRAFLKDYPSTRGVRRCDLTVANDIVESATEEEVEKGLRFNHRSCGGAEYDEEWGVNPAIPFNHIVFFRINCRFFYERYYSATGSARLQIHKDKARPYPNEEECYEWAARATRELEEGEDSILEDPTHGTTYPPPTASEGSATREPTPDFRQFGLTFGQEKEERLREPEEERPPVPEKEKRPVLRRQPEASRPTTARATGEPSAVDPRREVRPQVTMSSRFPSEIKMKGITIAFSGEPQELDTLDIQVFDLCDGNGYPAYYGGSVTGSVDEGWDYVSATIGKSNYAFGRRLCSNIASTLKGNAARWWEEYCKANLPRPNCWKLSEGSGCANTKPATIVEVSFFELLREEFSTEDDQQSSIAELQRLKWNPTASDAIPFATFKSKSKTLALRAGYSNWSLQCSAIRNCVEPLSLRTLIAMRSDEKTFWADLHDRANTFIADSVNNLPANYERCGNCGGKHETIKCRRNASRTESSLGQSHGQQTGGICCDWCAIRGHIKRDCYKLKAAIAQGEVPPEEATRRGGPDTRKNDSGGNARPYAGGNRGRSSYRGGEQGRPRTPTTSASIGRCANCKGFGHASAVCPSKKEAALAAASMDADEDEEEGARYVYTYMGMTENMAIPPPTFSPIPSYLTRTDDVEIVDGTDTLLHDGHTVDWALFQNFTDPRNREEVLEKMGPEEIKFEDQQIPSFRIQLPKVSDDPSGPVWTITTTRGGQDMMTIIDTGAVKAAVTRHTVEASGQKWTEGSDVKLIKADGTSYSPAGVCEEFSFRMGELQFSVKAYVVDRAPFQLLLGTQFMWATGAGVFPRWNRLVLTIPKKMEFNVSTVGPTKANCPPPLTEVDDLEEIPLDVGPRATLAIMDTMGPTTICAFQGCSAIVLGEKDLIAECDGPLALADAEPASPEMPTLTLDFVRSLFKFGPDVPAEVMNEVCMDIIEFSDVYSWHEFDLGCITDVPHKIRLTDDKPIVFPSRHALYLPKNDRVIKAKCMPLVDMGVYRPAGQECHNRAQLVVARRQPMEGEDPEDLKHFRVAHDFRGLNAKTILDPWPMTTLEEMTMWVAQWALFFKVDADRGFNQVVMDAESIDRTGFEMFHQLWVSVRMNFGVISGPATFARNADVMLGELKFGKDQKIKNYFDDIVGGVAAGDWEGLRQSKRELMEKCRKHGWKMKPRKESFGYSELEIVGHVFKDGFISVPKHRLDALQRMRYPGTATLLKSLLGLANTFRDRVPGFSIRVPNLTALTRMKGKIELSPEAIAEVDHIKEYLRSPAVLMCFQPGRVTYVYTDASVGFHDVAGGLGAVITQIHPTDKKEYVCAYASAALSPAQKNYHIARLEALAFVWICGKFNNWMQAQEIIWRNDSRANKFIQDTKFSHNPALCRYALVLQQFKYKMEWIPGVQLISDPLSRLVLVPAGKAALTLPEIVFGRDIGRQVYAAKSAPNPGYALQTSIPFGRDTGHLNRWVESTMSDYETTDGEAFPMYVMCEFFSAEQVVIPNPRIADSLRLSPGRTANPMIPEEEQTAFAVVGPEGVSPVCLSQYDRELWVAVKHCRACMEKKGVGKEDEFEGCDTRMRKVVRRLVKKMKLEDGKVWRDGQDRWLLVLESEEEFNDVMKELHDGMGHRQVRAVIGYFNTRYWAPASAKLIESYIRSCSICQKFSKNNILQAPGYSPKGVDVFSHWSVDFAGPFPEDTHTGSRYVIFAVDFLSRWVEAKAVRNADAASAATFLYEDVICRYGTPETLQSDNGSHFINEIITNLNTILGIHHKRSTPYYPQSNGRVERVVGTIKTSMKKAVDELGADSNEKIPWTGCLAAVLWVYRCTAHSTTRVSPAFLVFGSNIRLPLENGDGYTVIPDSTDLHRELIARRIWFISDMIPGLRDEKREPGKAPTDIPEGFHVGDWVWLRETRYDNKELCPVFAPRWTGPFQVWEVWDKGVYRIRSDPKFTGKKTPGLLRNPINGNRLKPYVDRDWKLGERKTDTKMSGSAGQT